ncbi:MAG TPA: hypothetical protein VF152_15300 [Acidimicrobiia bacterium]
MLYAFGFDRIGVVASDLYFFDPDAPSDQAGPEQGVRLEVRFFERGEPRGSVYSAWPIEAGRPIWRADLLESVANPGSLDRAHHHPRIIGEGWEPGDRHFVEEMSADPVAWVGKRLADLEGLLQEAGVDPHAVGPTDPEQLRAAAPEIVAVVHRLLDRIRAGELARAPDREGESARVSWL